MSIPLPQSQSVSSVSSSAPVVALDHVSKIYGQDDTRVAALDDVSVDFYEHTFTAIMGKTLSQLNDDALTRLRRDRIGFVFQSFNLVPTLDARANIELPLHLAGQKPDRRWLSMIVDVLGIGNRLKHRPQEMSGGQQQRVAVARALASKPAVIVADEPTGNLDSASSREVLQLLRATVDQLGQSVIMVTHDQNAALIADRVLVMRDGKIRADLTKPTEAQLSEAAR